jgi:YidC/Oxa1 family membrane protein insertase
MTSPSLFNTILVWPIVNVLVAVYKGLLFVHFPFALGFSIIILTIIIRIILYPLTSSQLKATKKMQELNPHLARLKDKHKGDAKTLQAETMKLYKEHGVNPAAGCLPVIIQLPIIWGLYATLRQIVTLQPSVLNKIVYFDSLKLSKAWDSNFFGVSLGANPSHLITTIGPVILIIPLLTALFQFIQSKMMFSKPKPLPGEIVKKDDKKKNDDFATAFQSQSMYIFPVMIGFFSWTFPIGLSLYWNTFTIFGIIQQYRVSGLGGLLEWKDKLNGQKAN